MIQSSTFSATTQGRGGGYWKVEGVGEGEGGFGERIY